MEGNVGACMEVVNPHLMSSEMLSACRRCVGRAARPRYAWPWSRRTAIPSSAGFGEG